LIHERFGKNYALGKPRFFKNKNKAQDAHEAIRPTSVHHSPDQVKRYLSKDQLALYTMIWQRFVASQMAQALIDQKTLSIAAGDYTFTASGSSVKFPGFLALYQSADDEAESSKKSQPLPELEEKSPLDLLESTPSSTLPSHRRGFQKPPWSRSWRKTASAGPAPMPPSSPPFGTRAMWNWSKDISNPRSWDLSSTICSSTTSRRSWMLILPPAGNRSGPGGTIGSGGADHPQPVLRPLQQKTG
jgi:hypothetical protein